VILFVFNLAVYYVLATIFGGTSAMGSKGKVFTISLATVIAVAAISRSFSGWLSIVASLLLGGLVSFMGLARWLQITSKQAAKVTVTYMAYLLGSSILISYLLEH
jgi:hypothetical protein